MRKYLILAMVAIASMLSASIAQADDIQSIDASITPTKLDKKKFKPAKLFVKITTKNNTNASSPNGADQPPKANNTKVDFPKNLKFDTGSVPNCQGTASQLDGTSTNTAKEICGSKSVVSVAPTSASVTIDFAAGVPGGAQKVPVVVTAFNGSEKNTIFLHARAEAVNTTSVLIGKLGKSPDSSYGNRLDVTIPPLALGAIDDFTVTVDEGKYVQARCKSKTNKFQATTTFLDFSSPTVSDTTETKCKQKRKKRR